MKNYYWNEEQERVPLLLNKSMKTGLRDIEEGERTPNNNNYGNNNINSKYVAFTAKQWPQFAASFLAGLTLLATGAVMVWTSPALPDLRESGKFGELTPSETSWIASIVTLGSVVSGPVSGYVVDRFGRKNCLVVSSFPFLFGWILVSFAPSVIVMIIGRFVLGFSVGAFILAGCLYVSEISEPKIRGMVMTMSSVSMGFGMMLVYMFGAFVSWFVLSMINAGFAVILIFALMTLPETPLYLISKGKREQAGIALMRLRGASEFRQIARELDEIQSHAEEMEEIKQRLQGTLWTNLMRRGTIKAIGISLALAALQQLCGVNAVNFYTSHIFAEANTKIDENISSIIVGVDIIVSGFITSQIIDRLGRRKLLIISHGGLALCLGTLGTFFYFYREQDDGQVPIPGASTAWIPLVSLILFQFFFMIGIGPLAWGMMSEILPIDVKGPASAAVTSFNWLLAFVVTKTFEDLMNSIGIYGCFWLYGGVAVIGLVFSIFGIPETRAKSLEEIHKLYFS